MLTAHKYFYIIDPTKGSIQFSRDTFDKFLRLMNEVLSPFNTNQHGGLKICMYCWSIVMRKKKLTHRGCPLLNDIPPEYSLAEAFGKADQPSEERYKGFKALINYFLERNYKPRNYNKKEIERRNDAMPWIPTFPKLTILLDIKHTCFSFYVRPYLEQTGRLPQRGAGRKNRSVQKPFVYNGYGPVRQRGWEHAWGHPSDDAFNSTTIEDDDDQPPRQVGNYIPHEEEIEDSDSSEDVVEQEPSVSKHQTGIPSVESDGEKDPNEITVVDREAGSDSHIQSASPGRSSFDPETKSSHPPKGTKGPLKIAHDSAGASLKRDGQTEQATDKLMSSKASHAFVFPQQLVGKAEKIEDEAVPCSSGPDARLQLDADSYIGKRKLTASDIIKPTLKLLGISELKIMKKSRVIEVDMLNDQFYTNPPTKITKQALAEWVKLMHDYLPKTERAPKDPPLPPKEEPVHKSASVSEDNHAAREDSVAKSSDTYSLNNTQVKKDDGRRTADVTRDATFSSSNQVEVEAASKGRS